MRIETHSPEVSEITYKKINLQLTFSNTGNDALRYVDFVLRASEPIEQKVGLANPARYFGDPGKM